jgi:hypothetical protein
MTQADRLYELLKDGKPHQTDEILRVVYGSEHMGIARIGARVADLKERGYQILGRSDPENRKLYWYKLLPPEPVKLPPAFEPKKTTNQTLFA